MDDEGAASALAFIVAGVVFLGVVAVLLNVIVYRIPPSDAADQVDPGHAAQARALLNRFVRGEGTMDHSSGDWPASFPACSAPPDLPGLSGPSGLDRSKLADLTRGTARIARAGDLDYATAKCGLRVSGFDFRMVANFIDSSGKPCASSYSLDKVFGVDLPQDVALSPVSASFSVDKGCDGTTAGFTRVDITLWVVPEQP